MKSIFTWLKDRFLIVLALVMGALTYLPLLVLSFYIFPSGDDFELFKDAQEFGTLGMIKEYYLTWSGRYASFGFQGLVYNNDSWLTLYQFTPILTMIIVLVGFFAFLSVHLNQVKKGIALALSLLLSIYFINNIADLATGFFWLATNMQYLGGIGLGLLAFVCYQKYSVRHGGVASLLGALVLGSIVMGLNEIAAFLLTALGLFYWFFLLPNRSFSARQVLPLLVWVIFFLVTVLAPGNAVRGGGITSMGQVISAAGGSLFMGSFFAFERLFSTPILLLALLLSQYFLQLGLPEKWFGNIRKPHWLMLLGFVTIYYTMFFLLFLGTGPNSVVDRVRNMLGIFFDGSLIIWMTYLSYRLKISGYELKRSALVQGCLILLLIGHHFTGFRLELSNEDPCEPTYSSVEALRTNSAVTTAWLDLAGGRASQFKAINQQRLTLVKEQSEGTLPLYAYPPSTIFVQDLNHPFGDAEGFLYLFGPQFTSTGFEATGPTVPPKHKF